MTKKLLHKTSRAYLIFSVLVLSVSAPLFYYITERLYMQETDETLILHRNEFFKYSLPTLTVSEIPNWNKYNRNVKIEPFNNIAKDTLFYTSYFDTLDAENEPYRELNTPVTIQQQPYTYTARINLVETEDLMKSIALLFIAVIFILLAGLFVITRKLSATLWKPFYKTLQQIEEFEIDKNKQPQLGETEIEEFNRLNHSIEKLIERNIIIYKSQREFIENAAHELQTPLAVFQAKIDTIIQRSDVTKEQSEILGSLNENVSRLNRLNKNLLLLSKIDNESYSDKQTVSLNELIEKHTDFFAEQAKAKNITIETNLSETLETKANAVLAEVLINNLFLNAIRHNITNGKIVVTLSNRSLTFSNTGQTTALVQEKLFNRFSKVNPSEQGTGLGLSIVKKIADINNWTIAYSYFDNLHSFSISF
ncbi:MAG: HAMP domain-containing histidine kinase [Chitinophagales bacterium]|nr:HAMP domain-containing histidine kinase [Chitinophagales bacterium]